MNKPSKTLNINLRLNATQEQTLLYQTSLIRPIFNWDFSRRIEVYKETGKGLTYNQQSAEMTAYKKANDWLYDAAANRLLHALKAVETFKNLFEKHAKLPCFKAKGRTLPSRHPNGCVLARNRLKLPKLGWVCCFNSPKHDKVNNLRVKQPPSGDGYICCVSEFAGQAIKAIKKPLGIDLELNDVAVITNSSSYEHREPLTFFRNYESKLAKAQKKLSRKRKGSKNRAKAKLSASRLHKRIANLHANWLHQLPSRLSDESDLICPEDLALKGTAKTGPAKSVLAAALGEFVRQVENKTLWCGKTRQKSERFFPSSKWHAACGTVTKDLKLSDSVWTCACGETVDCDRNAILNILIEGSTGHAFPSLKGWR